MTDWAALRVQTPIAPTRPTVSWPTCCDRPVTDMSTCRQRAPSVAETLAPVALALSFQKAPRLTVSGFGVFTIPTPNYNGINFR
jgi:hypothetical protein